jgi:hypothetical protein
MKILHRELNIPCLKNDRLNDSNSIDIFPSKSSNLKNIPIKSKSILNKLLQISSDEDDSPSHDPKKHRNINNKMKIIILNHFFVGKLDFSLLEKIH